MKNKIAKILGAVLTVVTLASLFVFAGPVSATAPDQAWATISLPGSSGLAMPDNITLTGPVVHAMADTTGNTLFAFIEQGTTWSIIRTTNFARSWSVVASIPTAGGPVVAIVSSDSDANVLYYATATTVYKSINALATTVTWNPQANIPVGQTINCMDAVLYGGRYLVAVGTTGIGSVQGNVYWMDESIPFFSFGTLGTSDFAYAVDPGATGGATGTRVIAVYFSPNFATDRVVFAVGVQNSATLNATTVIAANVAGGDWTGAMATAKFNAANNPALTPTTNTTIAQIFFPTDYNYTSSPRFYLAVNGTDSGLYWWLGNVTASNLVPVPGVMPGLTGTMFSLDGVGSFATANLMVGTSTGLVYTSVNGGAVWYAPTKAPTGAGRPMIVIMKTDFLTSHTALAIATGAAINDQSGVSLTQDAGVTFNQISLVNDSPDNIWALALGTSYTFAAGSRNQGTALIPGGTFTVTGIAGLVGSSFTVRAPLGSGDQFVVTVAGVAPTQSLTLPPGIVIGTDVSVTTTGTATVVGNVVYASAGATVTYTALRDNVNTTLTTTGGTLADPFAYLFFSKAQDPNNNVAWTITPIASTTTGTVNFVLPDDTMANFNYSSTGAGNLTFTGTATPFVTGSTWALGTVNFNNVGDTAIFTATSAGAVVTPGATFGLTNSNVTPSGATSGTFFPGAITLTNAATFSSVTFTGGYASLTPTPAPTASTYSWSGGVLNFFTPMTVQFQNNTLAAAVIGATTGTPAATTSMGAFPVVSYSVSPQIAAVPTAYSNFIWRYELATQYWERVYYAANQTNPLNLAQISASGNALYFAATGTNTVYESLNNGQTWAAMLFATPTPIFSLLAIDPTTVIVGGVNNTYKSLFNGFWNASAVALGNITSLAVSSSNAAYIVAAGNNTKTAISSDTGTTWGTPSVASSTFGTAAMTAVFEYGSTSAVYSIASGVAGVYRGTTRVDSPSAGVLDSTAASVVGAASGLASGATASTTNSVVYAQDSGDNNVSRITNLANSVGTSGYTAGAIAPATGSSGATGLWVQPGIGKNTLWSIYSSNSIREYIDYLAVTVAGVTAPAATVMATSAVVSWTAVPAGTFAASGITYQASITPGATALRSPYTSVTLPGTYTGTATTATFTGLLPFTQYTVTVWVVAPVVSFGGTTAGVSATFTTLLGAPVPISPAPGSSFVPINPSFAWSSIPGATGYELWISQSDPTFATKTILTVPVSGNPMSALNWTGTPLANNTTYYWEVRATAGTIVSAFSSVYGFTTVTAQLPAVTVPPAQTVILTQAAANPPATIIFSYPPVVTVTQAAAAPAPVLTVTQPIYTIAQAETTTPTYIWIIVGIGALLTLAVIILIIRTRRVV